MAVSSGYQTFVLDQLGRVLPTVRARRMFGGVGLYAGELFFALIDSQRARGYRVETVGTLLGAPGDTRR